jgi:triosephosphate isomerase
MELHSQKIIVANWKMNTTIAEGSLLLNRLHKELAGFKGTKIVICPPATHLFAMHREISNFKSLPYFKLGAQNISQYEQGAYTGDISAEMINDLVGYVIVGHSERRKYFAETDEVVSQKVEMALRNSLKVIVCVGENEIQRQDGHAKQTVLDQLNVAFSGVVAGDLENIIIAYEPVWAIGTGKYAKPHQVEEMVELIVSTLKQTFHKQPSEPVDILYGGSVDDENSNAYLEIEGISGLLVGGASLNYKKFAKIVRLAV